MILGLAATLVLSAPAAQAQVSFLTAPTFATGNRPESVTVGDLDGDGDLDLATTGTSGSYPDIIGTVSVLKNNGNGTFAPPQNFIVGDRPESITIGDLDNDGDLDLATANFDSNDVSVLKNNGDGTFATAQNFAAGYRPASIAIGDLDGDGDLDLAMVNTNSDNISVLKNNGDGTFAAPVYSSTSQDPFFITVGDVDGDGDLDALIVSNSYPGVQGSYSNEAFILKNDGNGTFTFSTPYYMHLDGVYDATSAAFADLDGDGDLDIAVGAGGVSILKNDGNGTFTRTQSLAAEVSPNSVTVGDLDGDGDLDIATDGVSVFLNSGNGTFATAQNFAAGSEPQSVTIGDLDGDSDLDLATANRSSNDVSVLKNNGSGTFTAAQNFSTGYSPVSITIGDLDGDGDLDLATANSGDSSYYLYTSVSVLKNNGNGTFAAPQNFDIRGTPRSITIGDLDGDGDLDLATANSGYRGSTNAVSVLKNNGNGTFAAPQYFDIGGSSSYTTISITVGDLDGDGDLDLATANSGDSYFDPGTVSVLKNNGNGTFATAQDFAVGDAPSSITIGDLDGDGDLDLATANTSSDNISVLKNNGNGTFATAQNFVAGDGPRSITIGDLDESGDLDLATANIGAYPDFINAVAVLKNNGNGTFTAPQSYAVENGPRFITVGDLDKDGNLDLIAAAGNATVLLGNGDGTFTTPQEFAAGSGPISIAVGDLNGDANPDLVVSNSSSDSVTVLLNTTASAVVAPTITSLSSQVGPVGTALLITGTGFTGTTSVTFRAQRSTERVEATFAVLSDTQISATVPQGAAAGRVTVTNPEGTATSQSLFVVIPR